MICDLFEFCKKCRGHRDCWSCDQLEDWIRNSMDVEGDLISRQFLIKATADYRCGLYGARRESVEVIFKYIEQAPAIDAEPARHEHWVHLGKNFDECSGCKATSSIFSGKRDYCPSCGAKMDAPDSPKEEDQ